MFAPYSPHSSPGECRQLNVTFLPVLSKWFWKSLLGGIGLSSPLHQHPNRGDNWCRICFGNWTPVCKILPVVLGLDVVWSMPFYKENRKRAKRWHSDLFVCTGMYKVMVIIAVMNEFAIFNTWLQIFCSRWLPWSLEPSDMTRHWVYSLVMLRKAAFTSCFSYGGFILCVCQQSRHQ